MLDREQVRKAIRGPIKTVDVPEWGGEVGIRKLSADDLMRLRELLHSEQKPDDFGMSCELLSLALCDNDGNRLFDPVELRDWDGQQADVMGRLIEATQSHNGVSEAASEATRKNSESGPTSDST